MLSAALSVPFLILALTASSGSAAKIPALLLAFALVGISAIDLRYRIIPDRVKHKSYPAREAGGFVICWYRVQPGAPFSGD